jgi:ABC-type xylose transport system substrate-binding protein
LITVYKLLKKLASTAALVALKTENDETIEVNTTPFFNGLTNAPTIYIDIIPA